MADTVIGFLLDDLGQLLRYRANFKAPDMGQIEFLHEDLKYLNLFFKQLEQNCNEQHYWQFKNTIEQTKDVVSEALEDLDSFVVDILKKNDGFIAESFSHVFDIPPELEHIAEKIRSIKNDVMEISEKKLCGAAMPRNEFFCSERLSRRTSSTAEEDEIFVGFEEEAAAIKDQITGGREHLEVISIIGMAGIGKTTLARLLYNDPYIDSQFYVRAWTYVSQVHKKNDLVSNILSSIPGGKEKICNMTAEEMGRELYRQLKQKKFLVVMDDIWDIGAWEDLRKFFPDDRNGSRIVITTRLKEIALRFKPDSSPHCLRLLTEDESWDLLRKKAFGINKRCPQELMGVGERIASKCQGLPLAIVVIAGLAKKKKTKEWWTKLAESLGSYVDNADQFMDILALSYDNLPHHLKPCFMYFGAFPKDFKISVRKLLELWIAEGFVESIENKTLEDTAEDYLIDLIDRSMVLVAAKKLDGRIKECRIHDMLHDLCLKKAEEKNSLQQIDWYKGVASPSEPISFNYPCFHSHGFHYISEKPCAPNIRSHFYYAPEGSPPPKPTTLSFIYKCLRVLDLWFIFLKNFPLEILQLFHLRYLAIKVHYLSRLPPQISNLWNLESLDIYKEEQGAVTIPLGIWKVVKLRHLYISDELEFEKPLPNDSSMLNELQSIHYLPLSRSRKDIEDVLARTPNLRKLAFYRGTYKRGSFCLPDLANLSHLESLRLNEPNWEPTWSRFPQPNRFPQGLKKLNLSGGHLDWTEISKLGQLPNLEVLKLGRNFFSGARWETSNGEFRCLKVLKLYWMDLQQWVVASSSHFPSLQWLVVERCEELEEIPPELGYVATLTMIEVYWSSYSAMESARNLQEEQQKMGNDELKVLVYPMGRRPPRRVM